jgi:hypothetical protein
MRDAPVAQLDRAPPSEGGGHTFESCRVRHSHEAIGFLSKRRLVDVIASSLDQLRVDTFSRLLRAVTLGELRRLCGESREVGFEHRVEQIAPLDPRSA